MEILTSENWDWFNLTNENYRKLKKFQVVYCLGSFGFKFQKYSFKICESWIEIKI